MKKRSADERNGAILCLAEALSATDSDLAALMERLPSEEAEAQLATYPLDCDQIKQHALRSRVQSAALRKQWQDTLSKKISFQSLAESIEEEIFSDVVTAEEEEEKEYQEIVDKVVDVLEEDLSCRLRLLANELTVTDFLEQSAVLV
eukprot:GEMP01045179.1.p1 GENE.GEMP01045179.1~~GEMP01045179.1.p1  ORF type:complete len:147 (+),score=38.07 GEMP01045179.1:1297-1737(+)